MTSAELRAWIKSRRLSHAEAAERLGLSLDGLRKQLYGVSPVGRQTEIIAALDVLPDTRQTIGAAAPEEE